MPSITFECRRQKWTKTSTLSQLYIDGDSKFDSSKYGVREIFVLEDTDRDLHSWMTVEEILMAKIAGDTAIPYGTYEILFTYSPKFKKIMPLVSGVKGFAGVRIHSGNDVADTRACPLTGYSWYFMPQTDEYKVGYSRDATNELTAFMKFKISEGYKLFWEVSK